MKCIFFKCYFAVDEINKYLSYGWTVVSVTPQLGRLDTYNDVTVTDGYLVIFNTNGIETK